MIAFALVPVMIVAGKSLSNMRPQFKYWIQVISLIIPMHFDLYMIIKDKYSPKLAWNRMKWLILYCFKYIYFDALLSIRSQSPMLKHNGKTESTEQIEIWAWYPWSRSYKSSRQAELEVAWCVSIKSAYKHTPQWVSRRTRGWQTKTDGPNMHLFRGNNVLKRFNVVFAVKYAFRLILTRK